MSVPLFPPRRILVPTDLWCNWGAFQQHNGASDAASNCSVVNRA
jgi:hypothetical protein